MKKLILLLAVAWAAAPMAFAQKEINKVFEMRGQFVEMKFDFAQDVTIEAWDKNTIVLQVLVNLDENKYNDYYSLETAEGKNRIDLIEKIDFDGIKKERKTKQLCNFESHIQYKLKVPADLAFSLKTISGEIILVGSKGKMDINTVSGFIDYAVPASHKMNLDLQTVTGDVYSNVSFDKKSSPKKEMNWVGTDQQFSLNGGNTEVALKTVSGNIYLRKL